MSFVHQSADDAESGLIPTGLRRRSKDEVDLYEAIDEIRSGVVDHQHQHPDNGSATAAAAASGDDHVDHAADYKKKKRRNRPILKTKVSDLGETDLMVPLKDPAESRLKIKTPSASGFVSLRNNNNKETTNKSRVLLLSPFSGSPGRLVTNIFLLCATVVAFWGLSAIIPLNKDEDLGMTSPWLIEDPHLEQKMKQATLDASLTLNKNPTPSEDSRFMSKEGTAEHPDVFMSAEKETNSNDKSAELAIELEVFEHEKSITNDPTDPTFNEMFDFHHSDSSQQADDATSHQSKRRGLQTSTRPAMHSELPCNDVPMDCTITPLSSIAITPGSPVTIGCGSCVYVDTTDGSQLSMPDGLRIEGKLIFPPSVSVTIRTTYVLVLGILKMETPTPPNQVKFNLYGEDDVYFDPHAINSAACGVGGCKIGSKVVAVAGGKLDIQGYPAHCPAWEKLLNVGYTPFSPAPAPPPVLSVIPSHCPSQLFSNPDLSGNTFSPWGGYGNSIRLVCPGYGSSPDCAVEAYGRTNWPHGIYQTVDTSCLKAGQYWKLTLKVKMYDASTGTGLSCNPSAKNIFTCPFVRIQTKKGANYHFFHFYDIGMSWNSNGDWTDMQVIVEVNEFMEDTAFTHFIVAGGPSGSNLVIDQVNLVPDYVPPNVDICETNMIVNGKGSDSGASPSPWSGYAATTALDCSAGYDDQCAFRVTDRTGWAQGMYQALNTSCFIDDVQHFKLEFKVKMYDPATGNGMACSPTQGTCPMARFQTKKYGTYDWDHMYDRTMSWDPNGWNQFSLIFEKPSNWFDLEVLNLVIAGGLSSVDSALLIDDVSLLHWRMDQIKVSTDAAGCWSPGSELAIATNTRFTKDHLLVTVKSVDQQSGFITLAEQISAPSTVATDPEHAVEVALLNRQIVFTAESDPTDPMKGGHFFIMQTPGVPQHIEGVQISNFGQAGTLGRYPLHFHLCEDVDGSVVKKNVVRQSNQRCYVIHGSNNVTLEDNVAYDTFGHCMMLEDGTERGNKFFRNLVMHTKRMPQDKVNLLNSQSARSQTDRTPGSFWITNTDNDFENNVAAGSEWHGWFLEMHREILGGSKYQDENHNPHIMSLTGSITNNTSHGHASFGWTTYPPGWRPRETTLIEGLRVYRGSGSGMFVHNADNHYFKDLYVADHGLTSIWIMGGDDSTFERAQIIGRTPDFPVSHLCEFGYEQNGFTLHPIKGSHSTRGAILKEVDFKHWSNNCGYYALTSSAMQIGKHQVFFEAWNAPHTFDKVTFDDPNQIAVDACYVKGEIGLEDVAIEVNTTSIWSSRPGFLVSPKVATFGGNSCIDVQGCLKFCPGACFRTVIFRTNSAHEWTQMMIKKDGKSVTVDRILTKDGVGNELSLHTYTYATHGISLPAGQYDVSFKNIAGNTVYPDFVLPTFEAPPTGCTQYVTENSFQIELPTPEGSRCDNLIKNGSFENNIEGWQEINAGISWSSSVGIAGSGALVTSTAGINAHVTQWIDSSCLNVGTYSFTMKYRVLDTNMQQNALICANTNQGCPTAMLSFNSWDESTQTLINLPPNLLGNTEAPYQEGTSFNTLNGQWVIDETKANAEKVRFAIFGGIGTFILDDIEILKV